MRCMTSSSPCFSVIRSCTKYVTWFLYDTLLHNVNNCMLLLDLDCKRNTSICMSRKTQDWWLKTIPVVNNGNIISGTKTWLVNIHENHSKACSILTYQYACGGSQCQSPRAANPQSKPRRDQLQVSATCFSQFTCICLATGSHVKLSPKVNVIVRLSHRTLALVYEQPKMHLKKQKQYI